MASNNGQLRIEYQPMGKTGKARLTARLPDGSSYTDKVDVADANARKRFLSGLCKGRKGIRRGDVAKELERIAGDLVAKPDEEGDGGRRRPSQADILVELAETADLFHNSGDEGEGYATITIDNHRETWPIRGGGFRRWLSREFYLRSGKAPGNQALQDALNVICGIALHDRPEFPVAVRVAQLGGAIYLDLADAEWRAVRIDPEGWEVVNNPPVRFLRRRGMFPLPAPTRGGSLADLRPLVNLPDDDAWQLFIAWLVAAYRPDRPFPILAANGEQGSAKTTLCRLARNLIDPNKAPLRRPPRDDRDLMIAATNGWVVAFDNLSGIKPDLADALCVLATGGGFGTRELYTDAEEKLFDATRPILINGIEDLATRSDLLDRCISLTLPTIDDNQRLTEAELWQRFEQAQPAILGALLDAVSSALRNLGKVKLASKPRMADFAAWVVAAEPALPWPAGSFLRAYLANRGVANATALEGAIIAGPILALVEKCGSWQGTAAELLEVLETYHSDEKIRKHKDWPTSPRKLGGALRRVAPNLRKAGIEVDMDRKTPDKKRQRLICFEDRRKTSSEPSGMVEYPGSVNGRRTDDISGNRPANRPAVTQAFSAGPDGPDDTGDVLQQHSNPDENEVMEWTG